MKARAIIRTVKLLCSGLLHRVRLSLRIGQFPSMEETASVNSASQAGTNLSAGTKRKRAAEPKFYAVRVGFQPGIYHTWADCLEQVKGFKKALCENCLELPLSPHVLANPRPCSQILRVTDRCRAFFSRRKHTGWRIIILNCRDQILRREEWARPRYLH